MDIENEFLLKFNFQKWLRLGINDYDYDRIGKILGIEIPEVTAVLESFKSDNREAASKIKGLKKWKFKDRANIIFIGDSNTSNRTSYMNILKEAFSSHENINFIDCALSAWRSGDPIQDFYSINIYSPDITVYMIGTNDFRSIKGLGTCVTSLEEYKKNVSFTIKMLRSIGSIIIIQTIPPVKQEWIDSAYEATLWDFKEKDRKAFNNVLKNLSRKENVLINDMDTILKSIDNDNLYYKDGLHLSNYAHEAIANKLLPIIKKALLLRMG